MLKSLFGHIEETNGTRARHRRTQALKWAPKVCDYLVLRVEKKQLAC